MWHQSQSQPRRDPFHMPFQQPTRSPESESAPQQRTTAPGWKCAITFWTTGLKIELYDASSIPAHTQATACVVKPNVNPMSHVPCHAHVPCTQRKPGELVRVMLGLQPPYVLSLRVSGLPLKARPGCCYSILAGYSPMPYV